MKIRRIIILLVAIIACMYTYTNYNWKIARESDKISRLL